MPKHCLAAENATQEDSGKGLLEHLTASNFCKVACTYLGIYRSVGAVKAALQEAA